MPIRIIILCAVSFFIAECDAYGDGFTKHEYRSIVNKNKYIGSGDLEKCMEMCIATTEFTCKSFDYIAMERMCYLKPVTKLQVDGDYWIKSEYSNHYQRDCA